MLRRSGLVIEQAPPDPLALPRDIRTDQSNLVDRETVGLADDPNVSLGRQVATNVSRFRTKVGRPGRWREQRQTLQARRLDVTTPLAVGGGTIRREVVWPVEGHAVGGFMSWAANETAEPPSHLVDVTGVEEYLVDSRWLPPNFDQWPVTGRKPALPLGWRPIPNVMAGPSTGWPVVAPSIPSFGSRIPLRRPRGVVSET